MRAEAQLIGEASRYERGDVDARARRRPTSWSRPSTGRRRVLHSSFETHQCGVRVARRPLDVYISTQFIWGVRDEVAGRLGLPPDKVRVVCEFMGGGFGSKNGAGDYVHRRSSSRSAPGRPVALRAHAARGEPRDRATATPRSSG